MISGKIVFQKLSFLLPVLHLRNYALIINPQSATAADGKYQFCGNFFDFLGLR